MGAKKKVDEKLYAKIKKELKTPKDDEKAMKKYKLGHSLIRAIRMSWCYDDYLSRTSTNKLPSKKVTRTLPETTVQERTMIAWYGFVLFAIIGFVFVAVMIGRWILSWFGA